MSAETAVVRLNVLLELFSECSDCPDFDALVRVLGGRLRWVIDFDRCTLALLRGNERVYWTLARPEEALQAATLQQLPEADAALVARVLASDLLVVTGQPAVAFCVPLRAAGEALGAICFSGQSVAYTYRDIRLAHHVGQFIGTLVSRMFLAEAARQLSGRKDELLAVLSHELRNPLAPIVTAVQLLKLREPGKPSREVTIIERQAQHLVRLVDDLLDVERLTLGKVALSKAPIQITSVLSRAVEMSLPLFEQYRHTLDIEAPSGGFCIEGDEDRLVQALTNLLNNAARYTNPGGQVVLAVRQDGSEVLIDVTDSGVGIAPEVLPRVFELFVQGRRQPHEAQGGLGLGLVVVKSVVELHGGSVSAFSAGLGQGAKFSMRLPAVHSDVVDAGAGATAEPMMQAERPRRVLLVDDNEDALEAMAAFLHAAGHDIETARGGLEALSITERFRPAVAVLDIGMPVMDGYELAQRMQTQLGADVPYLVALTGYGQDKDRERTRSAGFDLHLVKPVDADRLLQVIASTENPYAA
jgi:signal transduction histidine kinase/CheY-like chemotaxis protein